MKKLESVFSWNILSLHTDVIIINKLLMHFLSQSRHTLQTEKTQRGWKGIVWNQSTLWQSSRRTGDSEKLTQKGKLPFRMLKNHETPGRKYFYSQTREAQILWIKSSSSQLGRVSIVQNSSSVTKKLKHSPPEYLMKKKKVNISGKSDSQLYPSLPLL